jgi:hypothetical protein
LTLKSFEDSQDRFSEPGPLSSVHAVLRIVRIRLQQAKIELFSNHGPIFRTFFPRKILGVMEFSLEKVLKNHFFKKFHGIFCGKSLSAEIGPRFHFLATSSSGEFLSTFSRLQKSLHLCS